MRHELRAELRPYFLTFDDLASPIDWVALFGNDRPVELDVGSGRGLYLVNAATGRPSINFLGIELDYKEGRRAARRLLKRALPNARVVGGDAFRALGDFVPRESVAAVHVYFPDPWWKRKHKKRRLFTDRFVELAWAALKPGGLLHSWTDVEEYFGVIRSLMDGNPRFEALPPPAERPPSHDLDYQTSFERKKRKLGSTIHRGLWRKR